MVRWLSSVSRGCGLGRRWVLALLALSTRSPVSAVPLQSPATITVHVDRPSIGQFNPALLGQNIVAYDPASYSDTPSHDRFSSFAAGLWDPVRRRPVEQPLRWAREAGVRVVRYPGGCGSHHFDWTRTIGDPSRRPQWRFGVDEFLTWCQAVGAEPLFTLSYFAGPDSAADCVEYLNAPHDGGNPRGGVDWAARRAANGHPAPYGVRRFEVGNEDYHGDHRRVTAVSAAEYAEQFRRLSTAVRAVDHNVQLGAIADDELWTRTMLQAVGRDVDFLIEHTYWPGWYTGDAQKTTAEQLFRDVLASTDQLRQRYLGLTGLLDATSGRPGHVPIAVTEYNCPLVQDEPLPYRHSLGNALFVAEMLRVMSRPEHRIASANFWQYANEYWGAIRGPIASEPGQWVRRPTYYPFQLYALHFESELLEVAVEAPRYETLGFGAMLPCHGAGGPRRELSRNLLPRHSWTLTEPPRGTVHRRRDDGSIEIEFDSQPNDNYWHAMARTTAVPGAVYELQATLRARGVTGGSGVALQLGDANHPSNVSLSDEVAGDDSRIVRCQFRAPARPTELLAQVRRVQGGRGSVSVENPRLVWVQPATAPAAPYLTVNASASRDGRRLTLMVVNRHLQEPIVTRVATPGFGRPTRIRCWTLTGPRIDATNEIEPNLVALVEWLVEPLDDELRIPFPPRSCTAVEIE